MWTEHTSLILTHQRQNQGALSECKDSPGSKFWAKGLRSDTLSQKQTFMCECRKIFIRWSFELSPSHSYKINRGYRRFTVHSPRYAIVVMLRASFRDNLIFQRHTPSPGLPGETMCCVSGWERRTFSRHTCTGSFNSGSISSLYWNRTDRSGSLSTIDEKLPYKFQMHEEQHKVGEIPLY